MQFQSYFTFYKVGIDGRISVWKTATGWFWPFPNTALTNVLQHSNMEVNVCDAGKKKSKYR